jgi:hypothetical protein
MAVFGRFGRVGRLGRVGRFGRFGRFGRLGRVGRLGRLGRIKTLGREVFSSSGKSLKSLLESDSVKKISFDCRSDSDALFHQFQVSLSRKSSGLTLHLTF